MPASVCACVHAYLSDRLWDSVVAAGAREANGCVQADLVANGHIHRFGALVGAPQGLENRQSSSVIDPPTAPNTDSHHQAHFVRLSL